MKKIALLFICFFVWHFSFGQETSYLKNEDAITKHAESVTKGFSEHDFDQAFEELRKHWLLSESEFVKFQALTIKQLSLVKNTYGQMVDYKLVKESKVSDVVLKKTYVVRYQNHLLILYFTYYNNKSGWLLNSFTWNDSINDLF